MEKPKEEGSGLAIALLLANFVMLSALTWASSPIQKAVDALDDKHKLLGTKLVCDELYAMKPAYDDHIRNAFIVGCAYDVAKFNALLKSKTKEEAEKKFQEYITQYNDENTEIHEKTFNHCAEGASMYQRDGKLADALINIAMDKLNCTAVYIEIEKRNK